jgi:hypothetical protein
MTVQWAGLALAVTTVATIGIGHVLVRKLNYHLGTKPAPVAFLLGAAAMGASLLVSSQLTSALLGIIGITTFWDGIELIRQEERVRKGTAPRNPRREVKGVK